MQIIIAISLPVVVLLILGILLFLIDIFLSFLMLAYLRPRTMLAFIKRIVLKSINFIQKAEHQPSPGTQPAAGPADASIKSTLIDNVNHMVSKRFPSPLCMTVRFTLFYSQNRIQ